MTRALLCAVLMTMGSVVFPGPRGQTHDAAAVIKSVREALGGEQHLDTVKTFVATGRTRQLRGDNLVPIEFEISCELPDKYARRDEFPAQDTPPVVNGFRGGEALGPSKTTREEFARLLVGAFASAP